MPQLPDYFSTPTELMALEPEEVAGVLLEMAPTVSQNGKFVIQNFVDPAYSIQGDGWSRATNEGVTLAVAEALNWLQSQGLVIPEPGTSGPWHRLTRRGESLGGRTDLDAYRKNGILPLGLLQPRLAEKVQNLFLRGDHDTAVFQAFKEVEVAVRTACGFGSDMIGKTLMQKAFAIEDGPLTNMELVKAEREGEFYLFTGAVMHAKNPASHRDVGLKREEAARLIVFASHLLSIVEDRTPGKKP